MHFLSLIGSMMASPAQKRIRLSRPIPLQDAIDMVLQTDSYSNIPGGSDDENLSDEGGEEYVSIREAESDDEADDEDGDQESVELSGQSGSSKSDAEKIRAFDWTKKDLPPIVRPTNHLIARGPATTARTPLQMFLSFFDNDMVENNVLESNRKRTVLKRLHVESVSCEEMRVFIGICLYMSIVDMPFRRMYWASHSRQNAVADNMTCNRFEEILSLLHLNDNELMEPRGHPRHDPLFKVRPLLTKLNENFEKCAEKENCIAVDEMMVPFKGRHALKVYLMKKPKKWGYKVWVNAGQSGYVHKFIFAGESVLKTNDEYFEKV